MPVYSFTCNKCGKEFTKLVAIKDKDQLTCPDCGCGDLKQIFGRFNFVKITKKYNPGCNVASNCVQAKRYGCGKYAKDPVPPIS
ncbi:MAG: zinc ribbon domain-containing protein [Thermacetogeniaceae bacterium]|jgi:putative FmdB family regulatory protein|nr:zinc ribbon domain-containing protein [Syntrophomonadaceae bacterium]